MRHHNSLAHDLMKFIPWAKFESLVKTHGSDRGVRKLTTKNQFMTLLMAQLSGNDSLRAITTTMDAHASRLYHLGFRQAPLRSTLGDANAKRPAALYADLFTLMLPQLTRGQRRKFGEAVHLIDSSTIRLHALSQAWARDKKREGAAAKMHVVLDLDSGVPVQFDVTPVRTNDVTIGRALVPATGTSYAFDMGYYDFALWQKFHDSGCRFVTRLKSHTKPQVLEERAVADGGPVGADRLITIANRMKGNRCNPLRDVALREVVVTIDSGKTLRLVTNDLDAPAETIADLYKARWQIELFFKWMKQNLTINRFLGTSENAVRTQIAVAMIAFLLIKLAYNTQDAATRVIDFARLLATHLMSNRRLDCLTKPPTIPRNTNQQELQLC